MPKINCPCTHCASNVDGECIAEKIELRWETIITIDGLESETLDCYSKQ